MPLGKVFKSPLVTYLKLNSLYCQETIFLIKPIFLILLVKHISSSSVLNGDVEKQTTFLYIKVSHI